MDLSLRAEIHTHYAGYPRLTSLEHPQGRPTYMGGVVLMVRVKTDKQTYCHEEDILPEALVSKNYMDILFDNLKQEFKNRIEEEEGKDE